MDSCSDIADYYYDIVPGRMYKNWQGKLCSSTIDLFTRLEAILIPLTPRLPLLLHLGLSFVLALGNNKDILLIVVCVNYA